MARTTITKLLGLLILVLLTMPSQTKRDAKNARRRARYAAQKEADNLNTRFDAEWTRRRNNAAKSQKSRTKKQKRAAQEGYVGSYFGGY